MSLSTSLSNAVSGLTAAARGAEVVSSNVANVMTDGYGLRKLNLASRTTGQMGSGVRVVGIERVVNQRVLADRRIADGRTGFISAQLEFLQRLEAATGIPGEDGSLADRIAVLESTLIFAASRPDTESRLRSAVTAANLLASKLNGVSDDIQKQRMEADAAIARDGKFLNASLTQIEEISAAIARRITSGYDPSSQIDQRQMLIDQISEIIPVKEVARDREQIALISPGGGVLYDGKAAQFSFAQVGVITPDMTRQAGSLSGIAINGFPINLDNPTNAIMGGRLAGLFSVRDDLAVTEQARLDAIARDLVERFQDPAVDPTLAAGDAGLFTDGGGPFVPVPPVNEEGLSARIRVNAAVDPDQGGEVRRLRDGLNSAVAGPVGDATQLNALIDALNDPRALSGGGFSGAMRSASGLGAEFLSLVGTHRQELETSSSFAQSQAASLKELELRAGVDTDHEMQQLLLVEAAYKANARVIQTVEALLDRLMEL